MDFINEIVSFIRDGGGDVPIPGWWRSGRDLVERHLTLSASARPTQHVGTAAPDPGGPRLRQGGAITAGDKSTISELLHLGWPPGRVRRPTTSRSPWKKADGDHPQLEKPPRHCAARNIATLLGLLGTIVA